MNDLRLKLARLEARLTQYELGAAVGVPESLISKYETRRITPPREVQERIADRLGKKRWEVFP